MTNEEEQYFRDMLSLVCAGCVHCWDAEKCKECLFSKISEHAIEALKNQRKHGEWISCEDRLPEENGRFLVFLPDRNGTFMCADFLSGKWYPDDYECTSDHAIAWMELPKPYKKEGDEK